MDYLNVVHICHSGYSAFKHRSHLGRTPKYREGRTLPAAFEAKEGRAFVSSPQHVIGAQSLRGSIWHMRPLGRHKLFAVAAEQHGDEC